MWKCIGIYTAISHHIVRQPSAGAVLLPHLFSENLVTMLPRTISNRPNQEAALFRTQGIEK